MLEQNGVIPDDSGYGDGSTYMTPFDIFFNSYKILDVNFFKLDGLDEGTFVYKFRNSVAFWFYTMRFIASAILLCMLIYVGIRMAISTVADDKAKYKKMLVDWVCSLVLIFLLQYMAIAVIYVNDAIVKSLKTVIEQMNFSELMNGLVLDAVLGVGITGMVSAFVYCMLVGQTIFFFIAYINRMLKVGFLIIISPLISVTYSIDKMGDGKAQALNNWLKEFIYTILIQPFHCIMYIALINTALELVTGSAAITITSLPNILQSADFNKLANGVLAIFCLKFVNDGEKVVRKIFGFADDNTKTSMAAGAIATAAALKNAQKIGATARKGVNFAKNTSSSISTAFGNDFNKIKESQMFKNSKIGKMAQKASTATSKAKNTLKNSTNKITQSKGAKKLKNSATTLAGKYQGSGLQKALSRSNELVKRSLPGALAMMGMAMSYATGTTSMLEANALRKGLSDGSREFFNSSTSTQAEYERDNMQDLEDAAYEELENEIAEVDDAINALNELPNAQADTEAKRKEFEAAHDAAEQARKEVAKAQANADKYKNKPNTARAKASRDRLNIAQAELKLKEKEEADKEEALRIAEEKEAKITERTSGFSDVAEAEARKQALLEKQATFFDEAEIKSRIMQRANGPSKSDLENKKNEILKLIEKLQQEQSNTTSQPITEEESDKAVMKTEHIVKLIETSVLTHKSSINVRQTLGGNGTNETYSEIEKAVKEYENLNKELSISKAFETHASYNGDSDELVNAMYKNIRKTPKKEKTKK